MIEKARGELPALGQSLEDACDPNPHRLWFGNQLFQLALLIIGKEFVTHQASQNAIRALRLHECELEAGQTISTNQSLQL